MFVLNFCFRHIYLIAKKRWSFSANTTLTLIEWFRKLESWIHLEMSCVDFFIQSTETCFLTERSNKNKLWTKELSFTFLVFKYKIRANLQVIPWLVLSLCSSLKVIFLWFWRFQGLCHLLDDLSAHRGDLQCQPAPEWLGLHPVVQHVGDRTQGMENTPAFV